MKRLRIPLVCGLAALSLINGRCEKKVNKPEVPVFKTVSTYSTSKYIQINEKLLDNLLTNQKELDMQITTTLIGWDGSANGGAVYS